MNKGKLARKSSNRRETVPLRWQCTTICQEKWKQIKFILLLCYCVPSLLLVKQINTCFKFIITHWYNISILVTSEAVWKGNTWKLFIPELILFYHFFCFPQNLINNKSILFTSLSKFKPDESFEDQVKINETINGYYMTLL